MRALERRPLGTFASAFFVSACILFHLGADVRPPITVLLFAVLAFLLFCRASVTYRRALTAVAAGMLTASLFAGFALDVTLARAESLAGEERELTGTVTEVRYSSSWMGSYLVEADGVKVCLDSEDSELRIGDVIRCTVVYRVLDGTGDAREYMLSRGIVLAADSVGDVSVVGSDPDVDVFRFLQRTLSARLRSAMSEDSGGFATALVLGDRSALHDSITRDFRALGISHILALSGAHLAVICSFAVSLIPERRRLLRFFVICAASLFYMLLTGFSPSVVRSGVMLMLAAVGALANKKSDSFTSLSAAVVLICLVNPYSPYDVGLQLSYTCVLGIIISLKLVKRIGASHLWGKIMGTVVPAVVVPSVVLPLMWLRFGEVSLISPLANVIIVPVLTMLIPLFAVLVLMSFWQAAFVPVAGFADSVIDLILSLVSRVARAADPLVPLIGGATAVAVILFTAALVLALLCSGNRRTCFALSAVLLLGVSLASAQGYVYTYNSGLTVCTAASGNSFAMCAVSDGCSILVDSGSYTSAAVSAAKFGEKHGAGRFDALFLTKLTQSHMLAVPYLFENYYIESLWLPVPYDEAAAMLSDNLRDEARRAGIPVFTYVPGESLRVGECDFTAPAVDGSSVSFSLKCGDGVASYSSDAYGQKGVDLVEVTGGGDAVSVIPLKGAHRLGRVACGTVVSDGTVIRLKAGAHPRISQSQ